MLLTLNRFKFMRNHLKLRRYCLPLLLALNTAVSANPLDDGAQIYGSYTAGCIKSTQSLPLNGTGYQVMRPSRQRYSGHPDLISFIQKLGIYTQTQQLGTLLVGDLGQKHGGPMRSGHRSHQIGLDVDIWYWLDSPATQQELSAEQREKLSAPSYVDEATLRMDTDHWQIQHTKLLEYAANDPRVERIFVNPAIKRHLCQSVPAAEHFWLHKIRPWWRHADHLHVRLKCPSGELNCEKQAPVEFGDGCDATLDEWFKPVTKRPTHKKPAPVPLPEECKAILAAD